LDELIYEVNKRQIDIGRKDQVGNKIGKGGKITMEEIEQINKCHRSEKEI
jgi:hypothetical protein